MIKPILAVILTAFCLFSSLAQAADVSGTWTASFETQVGTQNYTYVFQVQGTTLTGTAKSNLVGEVALENGKVDGNKISFVENAMYQGMPITFNYSGEIAGNDEIHFKRELMGFPPEEFVAKRSK
jgi:hypothetical protein